MNGTATDKLFYLSGIVTGTVKDSEDVSAIEARPSGITFDENGHSPWAGRTDDKLYLTSDRFTSTLKDSEDVSAVEGNPNSISYNGGDTPWIGHSGDKFYMTSSQFTSTLKTSLGYTAGGEGRGIDIDDLDVRLGGGGFAESYTATGSVTLGGSATALEANFYSATASGSVTPSGS